MGDALLKLDNLQIRYGDFTAVSSASLEVPSGSIVSLIGANGAGKSSLLNCIAGLLPPASGTILFQGEDVTRTSPDQMIARGLSLVPQGGRCFGRMTVEENLMTGSYPRRARRGAKASLERVYDLFPDLPEKRNVPAGILSGGQRQMVAIGRALMSDPEVLLFDELSLGLAPLVIRDLYMRIERINREKGTTILIVEQNTELALKKSEICHVMLKGELVLSGRTDQLTTDQVKAAYLGLS